MKVAGLNLKGIILSIMAIFATIALFYVLDLNVIKSQALLGIIYYFFTLVLFMVLVMAFNMVYQIGRMKGMKIPGIYSSIFYKHLTNEQVTNLSQTHDGKIDIFFHEFIIMRLDIIFPASIVFALLFLNAIPTVSSSTINYIAMGELLGLFALSYLIYSQMQAKLIAIKLAGSIPQEQALDINEVIRMTAMEI